MAGDKADTTEDIDDLDSDVDSDDDILTDDDDDGDILTAEINVEELVAKIDKQSGSDLERRKAVKRRLEEIQEQKLAMQDLDSTYNFNLDDDF